MRLDCSVNGTFTLLDCINPCCQLRTKILSAWDLRQMNILETTHPKQTTRPQKVMCWVFLGVDFNCEVHRTARFEDFKVQVSNIKVQTLHLGPIVEVFFWDWDLFLGEFQPAFPFWGGCHGSESCLHQIASKPWRLHHGWGFESWESTSTIWKLKSSGRFWMLISPAKLMRTGTGRLFVYLLHMYIWDYTTQSYGGLSQAIIRIRMYQPESWRCSAEKNWEQKTQQECWDIRDESHWKSHLPGTLTWSLKDPKKVSSFLATLAIFGFNVFIFKFRQSSLLTISHAFHRKNLPKARLKTWWKWSWVGMRRISCFAMTSNKKTKSFQVEALGKLKMFDMSSFSWFDIFRFRGCLFFGFFFHTLLSGGLKYFQGPAQSIHVYRLMKESARLHEKARRRNCGVCCPAFGKLNRLELSVFFFLQGRRNHKHHDRVCFFSSKVEGTTSIMTIS